jgi:hypothetical protein
MTKVKVGLQFGKLGYIAKPFWEELSTLIDIGKQVHPRLKGEKRERAIQAELEKRNLTAADYERILQRSKRPFYTDSDDDDGSGEIVIPRHHFTGMLGQTIAIAPKNALDKIDKGLLHIGFQIDDGDFFRTGKTLADKKVRSALIKMEESNQRSREEHYYISDFLATATLSLDTTCFKPEQLEKYFEWAGRYVGIGSSRQQGYGRFTVSFWDLI